MPSSARAEPSPRLVTDAAALRSVCAALRGGGAFGFDTEFIRERSYLPLLCLVQVAAADLVALIDPFAVEMREFWEIVADPAVIKVVHAGSQDLEIGYLNTSLVPANLFDIQVAAALVGMHYPLPYGKLVHHLLNVRAPQDHTVSDWSRRPLSAGQLEYAAADVLYLLRAREKLLARLRHLGRESWLREEMLPLEAPPIYVTDTQRAYQRVRGWERLRPRELAVLCELLAVRDQGARQADLPVRTFLKDEVLVAVARQMPQTPGELNAVRGFPAPLVRQVGPAIFQAVRVAQQTDAAHLPAAAQDEDDDPASRMLVDLAAAAGQAICLTGQLNHALLASRGDYAELIRAVRRGEDAHVDKTHLMTGWRRDFAGRHIADLLRGQAALRVANIQKKPNLELE